MKKKTWDRYAPIYERAMRADRAAYAAMYERIPAVIRNQTVLEIASGPGVLAKHVAHAAKRMIGTDYSEGMIQVARRGDCPEQLTFEVADATCLPYADDAFDVVIIANALHVMPDPEAALSEITRVLRPDGILIAPNFVGHRTGVASRIWSGLLKLAGIRFEHQWTADAYVRFLSDHGWTAVYDQLLSARIGLLYVECVRKPEA